MTRLDFINGEFVISPIKGSVVIQFPPTTAIVSAVSQQSTAGLVYETSRGNGLTIYDATTLVTAFWSPATDAAQNCILSTETVNPTKFQVPTVASGNVYYGCDGAVLQYGVRSTSVGVLATGQNLQQVPLLAFFAL